ncbi:unnamed protein product [Scytosiphon promiscuus]
MIKQRAVGLGAAEANVRMGYYQQSPSRVSAGAHTPQQLPPPYICMSEQTSGSTCLTLSPSPQVSAVPSEQPSNSSLLPPDSYDCGAADQQKSKGAEEEEDEEDEEERRRRRYSEVAISSDGGSSNRSGLSRLPSTPNTEKTQPVRRVIWNEFDAPAPEGRAADAGRALARRSHAFKIFVIFRGGWCTSSHALLQGFAELNPEIKRAGGKVVALSSQTPAQVGRTATELKLPFQAFGDPSNDLVKEMNRRFNMGCTIARNDIVTEAYPDGMAQPCVLAVRSDDAQNEHSVLYKWCQWQTIASMKHEDAWAQITSKLAFEAGKILGLEPGNTDSKAVGGGPFASTSASHRFTTPPHSRRRPRPSTPQRSQARRSSPSSFASTGGGGGGGGYAPFAGHQVGSAASGDNGVGVAPSAATARATPAEASVELPQGAPQGERAQTIGEAVDRALAVGWMKNTRNPELSTPKGAPATADGRIERGGVSVDGIAGSRARAARGRRVSSWGDGEGKPARDPRGVAAGERRNARGAFFFPEIPEGSATAPPDARRNSVDSSGSSSHSRGAREEMARQEEVGAAGGGPSTAARKTRRLRGARDSLLPEGSTIGANSKPPAIPPSRPPTATQPPGVLPPQGRSRYGSDASHDRGGGGSRPQAGQEQQQEKRSMTPAGRSSRRFWFGSGSRRSSFEQAAADFNSGGRGDAAGRGGGGEVAEEQKTTSGRRFMTWPAGAGGGGDAGGAAAASGGEAGGEMRAPPTPRRWGYRRKGARPPPTPKPIAASAPASPRFPNPYSGVR